MKFHTLFTVMFTAMLSSLLSATAFAGPSRHAEVRHVDVRHAQYRHAQYARVIAAEPVYRTVERRVSQQECWVETVREEIPVRTASSATGALVGGVVGGAIGHAVGHGSSNKKLGAVVGTVLGMSVGNDISRRNRPSGYTEVSYRDIERCEVRPVIQTERRLLGYDVTYQYRNQRYTTRMDQHPGKQIRVAVDVTPMDY